jgi:hypothetical protein
LSRGLIALPGGAGGLRRGAALVLPGGDAGTALRACAVAWVDVPSALPVKINPPTVRAPPQVQNIKAFVRPADLPGVQNVTLRIPQTGCINDSSAPPRQRCWASVGKYNDLGVAGADLDMRYVPIPNNYTLWLGGGWRGGFVSSQPRKKGFGRVSKTCSPGWN